MPLMPLTPLCVVSVRGTEISIFNGKALYHQMQSQLRGEKKRAAWICQLHYYIFSM